MIIATDQLPGNTTVFAVVGVDAYITLQADLTKSQQATKEAIEIANYFAANLAAIENLLISAPFLNQDGKFFKKILWVLTNFNSIKELIEQIFLLIKNWRQRLMEAQAKQQENGQSKM